MVNDTRTSDGISNDIIKGGVAIDHYQSVGGIHGLFDMVNTNQLVIKNDQIHSHNH